MSFLKSCLPGALAAVCLTASASAVSSTTFTETFNTNASGWLTGTSVAPDYYATGGIGNSGYISFTSTFTSGAAGMGGSAPQQILFRANDAADASGDAFVGNWITAGVESFTVSVRHNYSTTLNFYSRTAAPSPPGAGASLADNLFAVAPNTWTTITIPITSSSFTSFGSSTFNGVFSSVQNIQLGFYLPPTTTFTNFTMDLDNVGTTVPEPTSMTLAAIGLGALAPRRRARKA